MKGFEVFDKEGESLREYAEGYAWLIDTEGRLRVYNDDNPNRTLDVYQYDVWGYIQETR